MKIDLSEDGKVKVDLDELIESRGMIVANSGGGKSFTARRFVEQTFGKKQIIIIDPEGEFGNLREGFDFVYIAKEGGDAPAEVRSAALLARRLMETKANAIIDIYELGSQRNLFIKTFLDACVNMPKDLWHDCFIILDEAHKAAPEKGQGESVALQSVIDMASLGRKRGYSLMPMTQRVSKLSKDVIAECNNKLIGRASLDLDQDRSARELGFRNKDDILALRNLEPGEFFAFGPAISRDVVKVKVGGVRIKPPKRGARVTKIAPPTASVKKILAELADLPEAAAKEATTVAELKAKVVFLERALKDKPKNPEYTALDMERVLEPHLVALASERNAWGMTLDRWEEYVDTMREIINGAVIALRDLDKVRPPKKPGATYTGKMPSSTSAPIRRGRLVVQVPAKEVKEWVGSKGDDSDVPFELSGPEQRILDAIALSESIGVSEPENTAVAFLAGYTAGGGGFNNPRGSLKTKGLIEHRSGRIVLTDGGRMFANKPEMALTREMLHDKVLSILPTPEQRILKPLIEAYPQPMQITELAAASGYAAGSGGFNNPKGRLRTLGLIKYSSPGYAQAADLLFP